MAFTTITSTEIESGKPVTSTTHGKIKSNFDDHESRLQTLESGVGTTYPPLIFRVNGRYSHRSPATAILETTTNFPIQITGIRILNQTAGSAGTLEIDLLKSSAGGGSFASLLLTKPSLAFGTGNHALSSNAILDPTKVLLAAGDILRLDLTSAQTDGDSFLVRVDYVGV